MNDRESILEIKNLSVSFQTDSGRIRAVDDIGFPVRKGKTLGLVGESGCGKSVTALAVMRLLPKPSGRIESGEILFNGLDLVKIPSEKMEKIRGKRISMIFQEPMTALNPVHRIGKQVGEVFRLHFPEIRDNEILKQSTEILARVGIPDPEQRVNEYPHQISGGMRQRVMIAMALAASPEILIADEPTTALDVTIQAQILHLIKTLQAERSMTVIFITHDMGVIAETCDDVVVLYAGKVAEIAPVNNLFKDPKHPYTKGLLSSIPKLDHPVKTRLQTIRGMAPSLDQLPSGCRFHDRCPIAVPSCQKAPPPLSQVSSGHFAACYRNN